MSRRLPTLNGAPSMALGAAMAGLKFARGDKLFSPAQGSLTAMRAGVANQATEQRLGALGFVADPSMSFREIMGRVIGTKGPGARVLFTEGTYHFKEISNVEIARDGVEFIALSPGRTVFRRDTDGSLAGTRANMLVVSGAYFRMEGITLTEPGNADYPSVSLTGGYAAILGCYFDTVYGAVTISSDYNLVTDCLVENNTAASAINITSGAGNVVTDNRII
jgi:hypothetical protein